MLKKFIILLLFPVITFASTDKYIIDKSHFAIGFLVEHVGYAKTLGMFREIDGNYSHDTENNIINDINIIIKTDSVFTNHDKRDEHLMSPDFLNVSKYPEMTFRANNIKIDNEETIIDGQLTLLGITKPLTLYGRINKIAKYPFGGIIGSVLKTLRPSMSFLKRSKTIVFGAINKKFLDNSECSSNFL